MSYKNNISYLTGLAICVIALASCEKVIELDLNSANPAMVIEANVSDQAGPYTVKLSKTINFSEKNTFPPNTGASVTINDDAGNSEVLTETSPGIYKTSALQGTPGRLYTISVTANGKNYNGASSMLSPVTIDTLIVESEVDFNDSLNYYINILFTDPEGVANYYRLLQIVNGVPLKEIFVISDQYQDGFQINEFMSSTQDVKLEAGDTVTVQLQNIDKNVYEYFRTFNQTTGSGGVFGSAPANPTSNISNGALGYFNACSVTSQTIILQ